MAFDEVPFRTAFPMEVAALNFDPTNPRLLADLDTDPSIELDVLRFMKRSADIAELLQSITQSGYVDIEPLIVMSIEVPSTDPKKTKKADQRGAKADAKQSTPAAEHRMVVLEGNRRLAALKLIASPSLAKDAEITVPEMRANLRDTIKKVTVYRVENRDAARDFIGFKHINGPHKWDSLAKARFAASWFEQERHTGITLRDIAARMGDRHDTIKRMVAGVYVLDQAKKEEAYNVEDRFPGRPFAFSHLYTALTRPGYRQYLGLESNWRSEDPQPDPVPKANLAELRQLMLWLYGSSTDNVKPVVVSQNPHVKELGEVLASPKAKAVMLTTHELSRAYSEVNTPISLLEKSLVQVHQASEDVMTKVGSYDGSDETLLQLAREAESNVTSALILMEGKRAKFRGN